MGTAILPPPTTRAPTSPLRLLRLLCSDVDDVVVEVDEDDNLPPMTPAAIAASQTGEVLGVERAGGAVGTRRMQGGAASQAGEVLGAVARWHQKNAGC